MGTQTKSRRPAGRERAENGRIYEDFGALLHKNRGEDGVNAVLKFLNEKERVASGLTTEEQLKYIDKRLFIKTRRIELEPDWYKTAALPMLAETGDGRLLAVIPGANGGCKYTENGRTVKITKKKRGNVQARGDMLL